MILIYSDSKIIDYEWIPVLKFSESIEICHSLEDYINHPAKIKIAFTTERMGSDYDKGNRKSVAGDSCGWHLTGFEDKINQLSSASQLVFSAEGEMHTYQLLPLWKKCKNKNVYWVMPGSADDSELNSNVIFWGDWFKITANLYKEVPWVLEKLDNKYPKEFYFDALLGRTRPHRTVVYNTVNQSLLHDKVIMTYLNDANYQKSFNKNFIWEQGSELLPGVEISGTHSEVKYYGVIAGISRIIPIEIFNKTAYSIVAETNGDNAIAFYTEKIAKPLIAKRLFIAFTGYNFLKTLKSQGFQTFDNVIDESYDQIFDNTERFDAAFEQVKRLISMDQNEVANKIKDIVEHNHKLIMETDWFKHMIEQVQIKIDTVEGA